MAATPQNVEMEAAKFLHKLIQESTDEPTKLATKLYVILQHMRSSGKENSMPYQVISRAMETVINRHGLDIEALMSSRQPLATGTQAGIPSLPQIAGPSQQSVVENDSKKPLTTEDPAKLTALSSKSLHGPNSAGHDIYQGSATQLNPIKSHGSNTGFSGLYESTEPGNSMPMQFSSSYDNQSSATLMHKGQAGKALEHEGGFPNVLANASKPVGVQGISNNVAEMGMHRNDALRDTGKLPAVQASSVGSSMPFKEHHLKQLRAQCLVFLAFRNNLMPKKLHLEIALGNFFPKEDTSSKEHIDLKGKEQSIGGQSISHEVGMPSTRVDNFSSSGFISETNLLKEGEKSDRMMDKTDSLSGLSEHGEGMRNNVIPRKMEAEMQSFEARELQTSGTKVAQPDSTNVAPHAGLFAVPVGESNSHADSQGNRHGHHSHLSSFPLRERHIVPKNANALEKDVTLGNNHGGEETSELDTSPASPKYTMSEKWIADCQKRKVAADYNWAVKKKKTEQRISACVEKLKETVSSSEDISAKTRSVIELKKLELLDLQRRLRNDILNDFFRPISNEIDRLKSIKKNRLGRRSKQLERYEQKMKEERQKRIRERQKDFFGEMELHRERLEDVFKFRRERVKGFNKYVREFHKRKERLHREKIDRIQREKINLLKINDVEGYLRMVQDAKSDRVKQLLKETEKYLQKLGSKLKEAKAMSRCFETDMAGLNDSSEFTIENEDETDQAKHYMESNEKYYMMAHSIKENITEQPASLIGGKLREYQMNGLRWLLSLYNNHLNGILADEMGLGKTVQVISLLCYLMENKNDRGPFLVVVPSSVLPGWETEINFWAPSINKIVYSGPPEERRRLFKERIVQQKFNVLLTTYEYLMNKHDRPKLSKIHWHYVIIDEGHRIKNASCKLNADLKHYRSSHRLLLTGTPLQNNLEELWALLNFLLPNIFNSSEDFSQWFNKPFESNADNSPEEALLSEEENLLIINRLHQVLRPFVLRRLKHKVENQLPEKIERLVRCEASAYQKLLMQRVEDNLGAFGALKTRAVHNSVVELRNICNHPYLSQLHTEEVHEFVPKHYLPNVIRFCGKLEMLDRLLPKLKATDHRVLLFSTMTRLLDVMEDYLYWKQYRYLRLDGHTSGGDRGALIDQFNEPGSPFFIFLLSIRAGGVGVNLQAADTVIIFDTDWNPQVDLQAQARAHRIGQKKDVLVLRLETVQTVEEQVRASAEHKLGVANQSITAGFFDNNTSAEDRREYLEALLRECKKEEAAPVLNDDALNDLIARRESEIDVFEEIDKRRHEEELIEWKKLLLEQGGISGEVIPPLPSRLVTDDDLKSFCEAMKATEVPKPLIVPGIGGKRKVEIGNFDTQQYGRGKRAREVRSYEEQWTEDEFEKLCQVEAPNSPNTKEEPKERNLPVKIESGVIIGAEGAGLPNMQPPKSSKDLPVQQVKEVNPPSKRGRGRPKKQKTGNSPSPIALPASPVPASSTVKSVASAVPSLGTAITSPSGSKLNPSDGIQSPASMVSAKKETMSVPPGFQPTASHPPGFQPTATPSFNSLTTPPPGYQPLSTPPGYKQTTPPPPGFQPKITSPSPPAGPEATTAPGSRPLSTPTVPAGPQPSSTTISLPNNNLSSAAQSNTNLPPSTHLNPTLPLGSVSLPTLPQSSPDSLAISPIAVTPGRGRGRGRGRPRGRGRGRGQVIESAVDVPQHVPQRRGRKAGNVVLAIPGLRGSSPVSKPETVSTVVSTTVSETDNKASVSISTAIDIDSKTQAPLAGGTPVTISRPETSNIDIASPEASTPATSVVLSSTVTDSTKTALNPDVGTTQLPLPVAVVPVDSLSVSPSTSSGKRGRGRGRKAQSRLETPRRRERKKEDTVDAQVQKSDEPAQKKSRASSGRKTVATRSMYRSEAQEITDKTSELLLNSSSRVKEQSSTLADSDVLKKSADTNTTDSSINIHGEKVMEPKDTSAATKSGSKINDADNNIEPKGNLDPKKVNLEAEKESKPCKEVEKSSQGGDILSQKVEVSKSETEHEEQSKECNSLEDAGVHVDDIPQVMAENELVQMKTEGKVSEINEEDALVAMEASPADQNDVIVDGASEVLPEVVPIEKNVIQTAQKSEIERAKLTGDSTLEPEATSSKKCRELSQVELEHEKQQASIDPIREHFDDTDKTLSVPAIMQGERDDLAIVEGSKVVEKHAESTDVVVDALQGETESDKVDREVEKGGINENVTDEHTTISSPVMPVEREDDGNVDGGTPVEIDDKSSIKEDFIQGETEMQKSKLKGEDGTGSIEKDVTEDDQSTKELCSAEDERCNLDTNTGNLDEAQAKPSERDNEAVQMEIECDQKEQSADVLDVSGEDEVQVEQGQGKSPEMINTESQDNNQSKSSNEIIDPSDDKSEHDEKDHEPPVETLEITKEPHVEEIVNQSGEGFTSGLNKDSNPDLSTNVEKLEEVNPPVMDTEQPAEHNVGADDISVKEHQIEATPVTVEEHEHVADISGGGDDKHSSEVDEKKADNMEINEDISHGEDDKNSSEVEEQKVDNTEITEDILHGEDDKHSSEAEERKAEKMEITEDISHGEDDKHSSEAEEKKVEKMEVTEAVVCSAPEEQEITAECSMVETESTPSNTGINDLKMEEQVADEQEATTERSVEERETSPSVTGIDDLKMQKSADDKPEQEVAVESSMEGREVYPSETGVDDLKMEEQVDVECSVEETESKAAEMGADDLKIEEETESKAAEMGAENLKIEEETESKPAEMGADDSKMEEETESKPAGDSKMEEQVAAESSMEETESKPAETGAGDSIMEEQAAGEKLEQVIAESSVEGKEVETCKPGADDSTIKEQEVSAEEDAKPFETGFGASTIEEQLLSKKEHEAAAESSVEERESKPDETRADDSKMEEQVSADKEKVVIAESTTEEREAKPSELRADDLTMQEHEVSAESSMEEKETETSTTFTADSAVKEQVSMKEEQEVSAASSMEKHETEPFTTLTADSTMEDQVATESPVEERETEPSTTVTVDSTLKEQVAGEKERESVAEGSMEEREAEPSINVTADSTMEERVVGEKEEQEVTAKGSMEEREAEPSINTTADSTMEEQVVGEKEDQEVTAEGSMEERGAEPSVNVTADSTMEEQVVVEKEEQEVTAEGSMEKRVAEPSTTRTDDATMKEPVVGEEEQEVAAMETMKEEQVVTAESSMGVSESKPSKTKIDDSEMKEATVKEQEQKVVAESCVEESESELSKPEADDSKSKEESAGNEHKQEVAVGSSTEEKETTPLETGADDSGKDQNLGTEIPSSGNDDKVADE